VRGPQVFSYVLAENARALEAGGMGLVDDVLTQVLRLKRPAPEAPEARRAAA
jgi:hypothetical protein